MDGSPEQQGPVAETQSTSAGSKRERSSIGFPYLTLDEAVDVATAIHRNVGTGQCTDDQLAPWLSLSQKSSGYRLRIYAAKLFGLVTDPSSGIHRLTDLGRRVVDPAQAEMAKADAFLEVPLFSAVFEQYRGNSLPPAEALEREFNALGVAKKQTGKARSSFERSAHAAGYFHQGRDRLVRPGFAENQRGSTPETPPIDPNKIPTAGGSDGGGMGIRHPFIEGLLQTLPDPDTVWAIEGRVAWLKAAATCFDLIYRGNGTITVEGEATETKAAEDVL